MFGRIISIIAFLALFYGSVLLVELAIPFLQFRSDVDFLISKRLIYHLDWWRYSFYIHVFSSPFVILSGLFQFNRFVIHKRPRIHRILGMIYVIVLIFVAAPSGFLMGLYANGSYPTQISFSILSVLWITTTILAYRYAKKGDYLRHSKWMMRSYALTVSAITLRFFTYCINYFNIPISPMDTYILVSYSSWIVNLLVAELLIYWNYPAYLLRKN